MISWNVYLSGDLNTNWRVSMAQQTQQHGLPVILFSPVTNVKARDECGVNLLGAEESQYWADHKGARINLIRNRNLIEKSDVVVVKFAPKHREWDAAFEAGYASAKGKPLIIIHEKKQSHELREIDASALAVVENIEQAVDVLQYVITTA